MYLFKTLTKIPHVMFNREILRQIIHSSLLPFLCIWQITAVFQPARITALFHVSKISTIISYISIYVYLFS